MVEIESYIEDLKFQLSLFSHFPKANEPVNRYQLAVLRLSVAISESEDAMTARLHTTLMVIL